MVNDRVRQYRYPLNIFNVENLIAVQDANFGKKLQETFFKDLEVSKQITLADWKDRSIIRKIMEPLCSIIDKQF